MLIVVRLLLVIGLISAVSAKTPAIVVNLGSYGSAREAIDAREKVDWTVQEGADTIVCTEALAALELRNYLCKLTGADPADPAVFPIVDDNERLSGPAILVGNARTNKQVAKRASKLGLSKKDKGREQTFRIIGRPDMDPPVVVLAGADRAGTLYAAYGLLDRLGVRWYGPGEMNEFVPRMTDFQITSMNIADGPKFYTRGFWAWEDRGTPEFIEWMGRNRMNFWTVEQTDPTNAKMRGIKLTCGSHDLQTKFINHDTSYPYNVAEFKGDEPKPKDPYTRGEYKGDANNDGVLQYKEVHPEWYGLKLATPPRPIAGTPATATPNRPRKNPGRQFNFRGDGGTNICDSNEDGVNEFMKNVVAALGEGRWALADTINFWMFDGYSVWCECDKCEALGTPTDRNLRLVYRLRQEILKAREDGRLKRDVLVQFPTYVDIVKPPTKPLPADFDYAACQPVFFPIERCYVHAFADPNCTELNAQYMKDYLGWTTDPGRLFKGEMFIGEYYNVSHFNHLPIVLDEIMRVDIPWYYRHGARHMHYMHTPVANWGTRTLTQWQLARMLWEPEQNVDALIADYYVGRYGEAAAPMRDFYAALRGAMSNLTEVRYPVMAKLMSNSKEIFIHKHMQYTVSHPATDDGPDWDEMMAALKEARVRLDKVKAMSLPEPVRARVAEDDALFTYAENMTNLYDRVIATRMALTAGDKQAARAAYADVERLSAVLKADTKSMQWGSTHVNRANGLEATRIARGRGNNPGGLQALAEEMKKMK